MSTALPPKPRDLGPRTNITVVASKYNEQYTDALVENTMEELTKVMPGSSIKVVRVPGAFEIPVAVEHTIRNDRTELVIALGLIIRGGTEHADLIAASITNSLQETAVRHCIPVIHEVLLVNDDKQAYARCIGSQLNRGREAARAACEMAKLFSNGVDTKTPYSKPKRPF